MRKSSLDGDREFHGVDMRREPATLEPGVVSLARNCRFRKGKAETRPGIQKLNWTQAIGTPLPLIFPFDFDQALPFATVYGAGRFDDPNSGEWVFIAGSRIEGGGKVWRTRASNRIVEEALPTGVTITGPVSFVQANDKLFLFRGEDQTPLVLDAIGSGFREVAAPEVGLGLVKIPNAAGAVYVQNRLVICNGRDLVDVSDDLEPEQVFPATMRFRINQGSSDRLVGAYKFNDFAVVFAKQSSLYLLDNLVPDADGRYSQARLDAVTTSWGWIARKSVVQVGADLLGLSQLGVMSLRQTEQNKIQGVDMPLSAAIQPLIDRINWQYAPAACGAYWDSKYYLAVPLDDAEKLGSEMVQGPEFVFNNPLTTPTRVYGFEPGRKYRITFTPGTAVSKVIVSGNAGPRTYLSNRVSVDFVAEAPPITEAEPPFVNLPRDGAIPQTSAYADIYGALGGEEGTAIEGKISIRELYTGVNNAVLVFDFVTGSWNGSDDGDGIMVTDWVLLDYQGRERLFYLSPDGFLNLYEEGNQDEVYAWYGYPNTVPVGYVHNVGVQGREIELEVLTRGYGTRQLQNDGMSVARLGEIRAKGATIEMATWDPLFSVYERPDGVNEEAALLTGVARSNTRYATFGVAAWDPLNTNDDHANPGREDYAVRLPVTDDGVLIGSGINFGLHQDSQEKVRFHGRGASVQLRVVNARGRMELKRVELESVAGRVRYGSKF